MADSEAFARPRTCPRCGARASIASNPYYGVGMAVHSHLWTCTRCEFVGLLNVRTVDRGHAGAAAHRAARWDAQAPWLHLRERFAGLFRVLSR